MPDPDGPTGGSVSCIPANLMGLPAYTDGINEGLQRRISDAFSALAAYQASCDPSFFPQPTGEVAHTAAWARGLRQLGDWVAAIGKAMLAAATDGYIQSSGWMDDGGTLTNVATGAHAPMSGTLPRFDTWTINTSGTLAAFLPAGFAVPPGGGPGDGAHLVSFSSNPYEDLLKSLAHPDTASAEGSTLIRSMKQLWDWRDGKAAGAGGTVGAAQAEGDEGAAELGEVGGKVLDGIGYIIGAGSEYEELSKDDGGGVSADAQAALRAGLDTGGAYTGAVVGELVGAGIGDLAGPVGGFLGGLAGGYVAQVVTGQIFDPGHRADTEHAVASAKPGSTKGFDLSAERQVSTAMGGTGDQDMIGRARAAVQSTEHPPDPQALGTLHEVGANPWWPTAHDPTGDVPPPVVP